MAIHASTLSEAKKLIAALELSAYTRKAVAIGDLSHGTASIAEAEYRHHLLLCWVNKQVKGDDFIVPSERADQIWHQHLLDSPNYRPFCDRLFGEYLDHFPGLEKDSPKHRKAVEHTQTIHRSVSSSSSGDTGFVPTIYVAGCGAAPSKEPMSDTAGHTQASEGGTRGTVHTDTGSTPAGCSASCGGGGGGCGGS